MKRNALGSVKIDPNRRVMRETKKNREEGLMSGSEEEVEDRTREHYETLLSEVALLEKMQNDYEKQMIKATD